MKRILCSLLATLAIASLARGEAKSFDFKDPKGVNNVVFLLDAPLESINGTAAGITGSVSYDPQNPEATTGKIVVQVDSMQVANPKMQEHLMGDMWMAAKKHPEITFAIESLSDVEKSGKRVDATANGTMTIRGKSKEMSIPVTLTYLEGAMSQRMPNAEGDILVARSSFSVNRTDFGINEGKMEDKVSDEVELRMSIAGFAPES